MPMPNKQLTTQIIRKIQVFLRMIIGLSPWEKDRATIQRASSPRLISVTKSV